MSLSWVGFVFLGMLWCQKLSTSCKASRCPKQPLTASPRHWEHIYPSSASAIVTFHTGGPQCFPSQLEPRLHPHDKVSL